MGLNCNLEQGILSNIYEYIEQEYVCIVYQHFCIQITDIHRYNLSHTAASLFYLFFNYLINITLKYINLRQTKYFFKPI